jgi:protein TonB
MKHSTTKKVIQFPRPQSPRQSHHGARLRYRIRYYSGLFPLKSEQQWYARYDQKIRISIASCSSLLVHALVIMFVQFIVLSPELKQISTAMTVVLVNAKTANAPTNATILAQHNLDGGGNADTPQAAKSPLPAVTQDEQTTEVQLARRRVLELERQARELLTVPAPSSQVKSARRVLAAEQEPTVVPTPEGQDLVARSLEIARLEAQINQDWNRYQQRPRRKFVGARTQEYSYARYIEDWRMKVERIGDLNYPKAARDQGVYGKLVATVSIRADGTLERVQIDKSSGSTILDEAAVRIVTLAAPYAPFSDSIKRDVDVLHITRTWAFTRADQFVSQ